MPVAAWDACERDFRLEQPRGRVCYGGLDLSSAADTTAFVRVLPPEEACEPYFVLQPFWIPGNSVDRRILRDRVPYDL